MFIVDDILLRSLGIELPVPFDMISVIERIRDAVISEMYNPEKIKDEIKENRLLYEFGEVSKEEYERKNDELMQKLELAEKAREMDLESKVTVLGNKGGE